MYNDTPKRSYQIQSRARTGHLALRHEIFCLELGLASAPALGEVVEEEVGHVRLREAEERAERLSLVWLGGNGCGCRALVRERFGGCPGLSG